MRPRLLAATATCGLVVGALVVAPGAAPVAAAPPAKAVALSLLGSYASGVFGQSAAEITAYDASTERLFVVNASTSAGGVDVLDVADPSAPDYERTLSVAGLPAADGTTIPAGASVNSVDVRNGVLAVAVQSTPKTDFGWAAFYRTSDYAPLGAVRVGAQPDMIVFADDATVLVANEAEPADADPMPASQGFVSDPEGSVSVIALAGSVSQADVRTARFTAFEGAALPPGVRVFGPDVAVPAGQADAGRVARNLEPEYIAVDQQAKTAYVTLQEANAIAVLDIATASFTALRPLALKDWNVGENKLDASDREISNTQSLVNIRNWPVKGMLMPDAIAAYQVSGDTFLVTANEGDSRDDFGTYEESRRVSALSLCESSFPAASGVKAPAALGRLSVSSESPMTGTCYSELHAFGGRSFSILDEGGAVVFDSKGQIEQKIAELVEAEVLPRAAFNASNTGVASFDNRSDDKGPEPEGVAIGKVDGRTYAFIALERIGGVMTFDISDPEAVSYVDYVNNRVYGASGAAAKDLGAEGIEFIAAEDSPNGQPLVAVANEVSGTTTLFAVQPGARR